MKAAEKERYLDLKFAEKEIEQTRFKEHRDQLLKSYENRLKRGKEEIGRMNRDIEGYKQMFLKNTPTPHRSQCELRNVREMQKKCDDEHDKTCATLFSESSQTKRQSLRSHSRKETADENTNLSAPGSLGIKHTSNTRSKCSGKRGVYNERSNPGVGAI